MLKGKEFVTLFPIADGLSGNADHFSNLVLGITLSFTETIKLVSGFNGVDVYVDI